MQTRVVAKVVVVNAAGKVLLLKRGPTDHRRPNQWDIPGGHTEEHELAEEAAIRETQEEAGIDLRARNLNLVYSISEVAQDDLSVVWLFYIAQVQKPEVTISHEHSEFAWMSIDGAIEAIDYDRQKRAFSYIRDNHLI